MPKFGTHIIFAENALRQRPDLFEPTHLNALRLGAIGPDTTLFMFDPATNDPSLRRGIEAALDVLETVQTIKERVTEAADMLTKPVDDLGDWLSGGLTTDLKYLVNAGLEALMLAAKLGIAVGAGSINVKNPIFHKLSDSNLPVDFITNLDYTKQSWVIDSADQFGFPFRMFGHPFIDDGAWKQPEPPGDYSNWWWMDILHYRQPGTFASQLRANASGDVQTSFANGYMTHVAGDICGHPFINALVGGPFRNHAYRHLVLETLADTWLWDNQGRGDILGARLDDLIDLTDAELDQVAQLVVGTMRQVYRGAMVPSLLRNGYPEPDEFAAAYRLLKQYLRLSTSGSIKRPSPPPDTPKEVFEEIKNLLKNNVPGSPPTWSGNLVEFLQALFSWAGKGLTLLIMLATLPFAVMIRFLTIAPRWIIYLLNLAVFYLISAIRTMICLVGWGYCGSEDFRSFGFLENWLTTPGFDNGMYPVKTLPNPKLPFYWLIPPEWFDRVEEPPTFPMAPARGGLRPDWLVDTANQLDPSILQLWNVNTPADTLMHYNTLGWGSGFGNAVDFSIALLEGSITAPDFDLDGDRGFGYRGWEELPPNERYV